jgi:hypothetical protein
MATSGLQAAMISGTVTGSDGGSPITEGRVDLYNLAGNRLGRVDLDGAGAYSLTDLEDGDYLLYFNAMGAFAHYVDEVYDDVACPGLGCDFRNLGAAVTISGTDSVIDAELNPGLSITGTITTSDTLLPLEGVRVRAVATNVNNNLEASFFTTGADGSYTLSGLVMADYFLYFQTTNTGPTAKYYGKAYSDIPCNLTCTPSKLTAVTAIDPGPLVINAVLEPGVVFTGTITESTGGTPIIALFRFSGVNELDGFGGLVQSNATDGTFRTNALPPGEYIASYNSNQHVDEFWDDVSCRDGCSINEATPIIGVAGETLVLDADLEFTSGITGTLTASDTNLPIFPDGQVSVLNEAGQIIGNSVVEPSGNYRVGLPAGSYYLFFFSNDAGSGYVGELYDNIPCANLGCDVVNEGTLVVKGADDVVVNAKLDRGATLSGTVTNEETTLGIPFARVRVFNDVGQFLFITNTNVTGNYSFAVTVGEQYYLQFSQPAAGPPYVPEVHDDVPCAIGCDPTVAGTSVMITELGNTVIDAALAREQIVFSDGFEKGGS